jgi:predicted nucleotidyltransferase
MDFAQRSGLHRNTVNLYLKGKEVFADAFVRIAAALGCDPLDLAMPVSDADVPVKDMDEIRPIVAALARQDKQIAALLIGSRAKGKHHQHADWDIGITRCTEPISSDACSTMKQAIDDIADDLPHGVHLVNLDESPRWFLEGIDYAPIFLDGDRESFIHFMGVLNGIKRSAA